MSATETAKTTEGAALGDSEEKGRRVFSRMYDPPAYQPDKDAFDPDPEIAKVLEAMDTWAAKGVNILAWRTSRRPRESARIEIRPGMKAKETRDLVGKKLRESKVVEGFDDGSDLVAPFASNNPEQEFLQLLGGPFSKQLYLAEYLSMHAKCWWEITHNPLARLMVDMMTDYVVGRGVKWQAKDETFQKAIDDWAIRQKFHQKLRQYVHDESWQGEGMLRKYVNKDEDFVLRLIDPSTCWEVEASPDDTEDVKGYWLNFPGAYNISTYSGVAAQTYTVEFVPAADVIHSKINVASGEKRGRSDLFPGLAWFKRYRDFTAAIVYAAQYAYAYVFDVEIDGDESDIARAQANPQFAKVPKPGSSWLHNKPMKITPMSSNIGQGFTATKEITVAILRGMAACFNMPLEYLGVSEGGTKASAIAKTSPWAKHIAMRQFHIETDVLMPLRDALYDFFLAKGTIKAGTPRDVEWTFPEPAPEDVDTRLKRLDYLWRSGRITHKRSSIQSAGEVNLTNYDYETELKDIEDEIAKGVDQMVQKINQDAAALASAADDLDSSTGRMSPGDRSATKDSSTSLK